MSYFGETKKKIILAFTKFKEIDYELLQLFVLGVADRSARESSSFDHKLNWLRVNGFIEDVVDKQRDERGVIQASRFYILTEKGKKKLLELQMEKNRHERERKRGRTTPKHKSGGDRWTEVSNRRKHWSN